jgi:hypothetical protein
VQVVACSPFDSNWQELTMDQNMLRGQSEESKMRTDLAKFQSDLLESVKQMRRGQAARVTKVKVPPTAEARARVGLSQ